MSIHRFYCPSLARGTVELDADESRHALVTLRLRPGDDLHLFDGAGGSAVGRLLPEAAANRSRSRSAPSARVQIEEITRVAPDPQRLVLLTAAPKGPRLDWLIEKCTELNVATLILAEFERSVVRLTPSVSARHIRTAIEASKQCGRLWLPEVRCGESLRDAVGRPDEQLLVCDPSPRGRSLANHLRSTGMPERVTVVIGPEGGIAPAERDWLSQRGAVPVRLSDTILRIETAAAAVAAVWAAFRCDAAPS